MKLHIEFEVDEKGLKILSENSLERVLSQATRVLLEVDRKNMPSTVALAGENAEDIQFLKSIASQLWYSASSAAQAQTWC